jgi:hypothetical protein
MDRDQIKVYVCNKYEVWTYCKLVVLGGVIVIVLLDPNFIDSNPAESDGFLRMIKSFEVW